MLNNEQIEKIKKIVAETAYEAKTVDLIDSTLIKIEEELGRDYTVAYVLPSEWSKKNLGCAITFMVLEKATNKIYDFSIIPRTEVMVETSIDGD